MAEDPKFTSMADAVREFSESLKERNKNDFFPTGFATHDNALAVFAAACCRLSVPGPRWGKTAFMLSIALEQLMAGIKVYFFTLEMPQADMIARLVSIKTGVRLLDILQARISEDEGRRIVGALPSLSELTGEWTQEIDLRRMEKLFQQIEKKSRSIVYVDFLGLIQVPGLDAAQTYAMTTECGLALKRSAIELQTQLSQASS